MYNFKTKSGEQKYLFASNELFRRFSMQFELALVSTIIIITTMLIIYNIEFTIL
jgi:hypothetical protein